MSKFIPYAQQWVDEADIRAVVKVLKSDWLTQGPKIAEFEKDVADYTGAKYAVAVSSGTAALHCACLSADIKKGDEVITTPITFAASANSVLYCGAKPVFADIKPDTWNINPKEIERKISSKTRAIIPVDFTGQPADLDEIKKIARKHKLVVIEDAAHAMGAIYKGKKVGGLSDLTILSFHPVKHVTTGEGGMILTNNFHYYQKLLMIRTHGITRRKDLLTKDEGSWYYEMHHLGYNYRLTDFQCALGLNQLKRLNQFLARRRSIVTQYNEAFKKIKEITIPYETSGVNSAWHLYIIRVKSNRREIFEALRRKKIQVNVHYIPVYYHPYYRKLGYKKGICSNAERYYEEAMTLPLFPKMTDSDVDYVIKIVKNVIGLYRK
ncbi:MAG: UDP-4-amino-4,6-dideoxy-N-acetyl-beta-L-altrosamine transaminase [Planctomycetes bacterium]|nr:UDP-4-amino-4,6-dideoxy-N-acetyl-beta-L-altrosamine transaminase [Planctomycetota bacterium]